MTFRRLVELRQARVNRLVKEREEDEKRQQKQQDELARKQILKP